MAQTLVSGVQYSGTWNLTSQGKAQAAGTWPVQPNNLWSWGSGETYGVTGQSNKLDVSSPVQVGSNVAWLSLSAGAYNVFALRTNGTLWGWGNGSSGQLDSNQSVSSSSPVQVGTSSDWAQVSVGNRCFLGVKTNGTLWGCGEGSYGQLGNNTNNQQYSSPIQIGALTNWLSVANGYNHAIGIKTNGTLWAWGRNLYGQIGNGQGGNGTDSVNVSSPVQIGSETTWLRAAAGYGATLAIKTDGTLWAWGWNSDGQLGQGDIISRSSPVQVGSATNWAYPTVSWGSSGDTCTCVTTGNSLFIWGYNGYGQVGDGTTTNRSLVTQVGGLTNWAKSDCRDASVVAYKTNGTLWTWGFNSKGQLGLGNTTNYLSPMQVGSGTKWNAIGSTYRAGLALSGA